MSRLIFVVKIVPIFQYAKKALFRGSFTNYRACFRSTDDSLPAGKSGIIRLGKSANGTGLQWERITEGKASPHFSVLIN
jgi:hypothetical protein